MRTTWLSCEGKVEARGGTTGMHKLDIPIRTNSLERSFGWFVEVAAIECDIVIGMICTTHVTKNV